jgi:hypothetical protein
MGGKAGKILPLVAMAVAAYFTGGAALAATAAQTAGTTATAMAGSLSSAGLAAAEASMMAQAAAATALQNATLAWAGASAVGGVAGAAANAQAQKQALAIEAEQRRVQQLGDTLSITQGEASVQNRLKRVLAAQTVAFNARGIDPGAGSPLAVQEGAYQEAKDDLGVLATRRQLADIGGTLNAASFANRRSAINRQFGQSLAGSLLSFGRGVTKAMHPVRED